MLGVALAGACGAFGRSVMTDRMTGGCQCGRIRYTVDVLEADAYLCHCKMCRRATGGASIAFVGVPVRLGANGAEKIYEIELSAAEKEAFTKSVAANTELMTIARGFLT